MKAIILAGGQATRLRPITEDLPKCMLKVGELTIIEFQINTLKDAGVLNIIIVTGFKAKLLENFILETYKDTALHFTFVFNSEYESTRAAYGLWTAREYLNEETIYLNSDLYCEKKIFEEVINHEKDSVTAIQNTPWDEEEVNVVIDSNSKVEKIGKLIPEHESSGEFIGATKLSKEFLESLISVLDDMVGRGDKQKFAVDAIQSVIDGGKYSLFAHNVTRYKAIEIDSIEDYENGKKLWEK